MGKFKFLLSINNPLLRDIFVKCGAEKESDIDKALNISSEYISSLEDERNELNKKHQDVIGNLSEYIKYKENAEKKYNALSTHHKTVLEEYSSYKASAEEKYQNKENELTEYKKTTSDKIQGLQNEYSEFKSESKNYISSLIVKYNSEVEKLKDDNTKLAFENANLINKNFELSSELKVKKNQLLDLQNDYNAFIEKHNKEIENYKTEIEDKRTLLYKSEKECDALQKRISVLKLKLGEEQQKVLDIMNNTNENLFITGKAGTGKSVLLQHFVNYTHKKVAVVAPTGVAAINVQGQTIHSLFCLAPAIQDTRSGRMVRNIKDEFEKVLQAIDALIIDEISMVRADIMDMIDAKLKHIRHSNLPFGGCQIIAFGDLYQLSPIGPKKEEEENARFTFLERYPTLYFFGAPVIIKNPFRIIELQHVFRQPDGKFIELLNKIRLGDSSNDIIEEINSTCRHEPTEECFVLASTNKTVKEINDSKLSALDTEEMIYEGNVSGKFEAKDYPTELNLKLKVGAQVMMIKNDPIDSNGNYRWVNGTLGIIEELTPDLIKVRIKGIPYSVNKEKWENYEYFEDEFGDVVKNTVGVFEQYPIKLAYAITIHKSQGQTYDAIKIDLSYGAFAAGQTYVALSRCRRIESIFLARNLRPKDIKVSQEVIEYMNNCKTPLSSIHVLVHYDKQTDSSLLDILPDAN